MKIGVIVFPGSNCDRDAAEASRALVSGAWSSKPETQQPGTVTAIWHRETKLPELDLVILPGGFSYGDYLRSGAMAARSPIMGAIREHVAQGRLLLGICNGFQVLTETGLLPGTLMRNAQLSFVCKSVHLRVENTALPFTRRYQKGQVISVPVAHGEGNYYANRETLKRLEDNDQIVFRYCDSHGSITAEANPNGSLSNIAGICNAEKTVLGMMPHPERVCDPLTGGTDGQALFSSLLAA